MSHLYVRKKMKKTNTGAREGALDRFVSRRRRNGALNRPEIGSAVVSNNRIAAVSIHLSDLTARAFSANLY